MLNIKVDGISCGSCVRRIIAAVSNLDDEAVVEVDQAAGMVSVQADLEAGEVIRAIEDAGYAATVLSESER